MTISLSNICACRKELNGHSCASECNDRQQAIHEYAFKYGYGVFPVVDKEYILGILTLKEVMDVREEKRNDTMVSELFVRHEKGLQISKKEEAIKALEKMISEDKGRLAVLENRRLIGLITRTGIKRYT